MLIKEAKWLGEKICKLSLNDNAVFLNFGSQSDSYNKSNKYIETFFLNPIRNKYLIKNLDLNPGKGIDYAGNICDEDFYTLLKNNKFDCVLLCNVLEHVTDIEIICERLSNLLKKNDYLIFSGPYKYPTHYDPIDNGFRPNVNDITKLFPDFKVIYSETITDFTYKHYLFLNIKDLFLTIFRVLTPFYKFNKWKKVVIPKFKYWNKEYKITCVILKKES